MCSAQPGSSTSLKWFSSMSFSALEIFSSSSFVALVRGGGGGTYLLCTCTMFIFDCCLDSLLPRARLELSSGSLTGFSGTGLLSATGRDGGVAIFAGGCFASDNFGEASLFEG